MKQFSFNSSWYEAVCVLHIICGYINKTASSKLSKICKIMQSIQYHMGEVGKMLDWTDPGFAVTLLMDLLIAADVQHPDWISAHLPTVRHCWCLMSPWSRLWWSQMLLFIFRCDKSPVINNVNWGSPDMVKYFLSFTYDINYNSIICSGLSIWSLHVSQFYSTSPRQCIM